MKANKPYLALILSPAKFAELDAVAVTATDEELLTALKDEEAIVGVGVGELALGKIELAGDVEGSVPVINEVVAVAVTEVEISHMPVFTFGQQGSLATKVQLLGHVGGHCGSTAGRIHALIHGVGAAVREMLV